MKCITIIISVYRQAHHYLNPIYVDKIFHNNINQQLSLSRINSTTSLYSFISPPLFLILTYFSYFVAFFLMCFAHFKSLFRFCNKPPNYIDRGKMKFLGYPSNWSIYFYFYFFGWVEIESEGLRSSMSRWLYM